MKCVVHNYILILILMSIQVFYGGEGMKNRLQSKICSLHPEFPKEPFSPSSIQLPCYAAEARADQTEAFAQTAHGISYPSLTASQAIGTQGHILLQDVFLLEKLQSFNRERIPERVVHAKGAAAMGYFQVTNDVSKYTKADFLKKVGLKTRVTVRFSNAAGESGSADTSTVLRGFATKFYTQKGIYDLVGNSIQVFPIRDPMLFVDFNRAMKRNPQTHLVDPTAFWDITSLRPEMTMHTLYLFSDSQNPKSYTYINGAGIHTFKMVNAKKSAVYVKFHWISNQKNKQYFTPKESIEMAGTNPDVLSKDLFDRIEKNDYPTWNLSIQVMTFDQAASHSQNPFDVTKFWKPEDYPMIPVGIMTLNENPLDYFTQVEQLAFSPSHMVPGIEASPDRMLIARMFSYPDSQMYRLGVNFAQIPVNRCPFQVNTYQRDGRMNVESNGAGAPNYYPNSFNGLNVDNSVKQSIFYVSGNVDRMDTRDDDNFSLPSYYLKKYVTDDEKKGIVSNIANDLGRADKDIQRKFVDLIANKVSQEFGDDLRKALGLVKKETI